jgi:hypothetical protein
VMPRVVEALHDLARELDVNNDELLADDAIYGVKDELVVPIEHGALRFDIELAPGP